MRFVVYDITGVGGTVRAVSSTANALAAAGYRVQILSVFGQGRGPRFELAAGVSVRALSPRRHETPPDGVHWHPVKRVLLSLPSVLVSRHDAAYERFSLWSDLALWRARRAASSGLTVGARMSLNLALVRLRWPSPLLLQEHVFLDSYPPAQRRRIARAYRRADALTVITEQDASAYRAALRDRSPGVTVIPNEVAPENVGEPRGAGSRIVLAVTRLAPEKGVDLLVEAFVRSRAAERGWRLVVAGSGAERPALQQLVDAHEAYNAIHLLGARDDVAELLSRAEVFVLSSRHEGFGIALIEAMASGLPVVSFDCPVGPREIVSDGVDGLLVPAEDVDAMAAALARVTSDPDLRARLGSAAAVSARRFRSEAVGAQWVELVGRLVGAPAEGGA